MLGLQLNLMILKAFPNLSDSRISSCPIAGHQGKEISISSSIASSEEAEDCDEVSFLFSKLNKPSDHLLLRPFTIACPPLDTVCSLMTFLH